MFWKSTWLEDWEFFEAHIDNKLNTYKEIFRGVCLEMLKEYVSDAEKEMWLVSEARVALESEVNWWWRDRSDNDMKVKEIVSEFE